MAVTISADRRIDQFTPGAGADPFVDYVTKPNADNTGVRASALPLDVVAGTQTFSTPNQIITGKRFTGKVVVTASSVWFVDCEFNDLTAHTVYTPLFSTVGAAITDIRLDFCTVHAGNPTYQTDGIRGHDMTIYRCQIYDTVDGMKPLPASGSGGGRTGFKLLCSYIHDLAYFTPDPTHPDNRVHNDAIQIAGGNDIQILGNTIVAFNSPLKPVGKSQDDVGLWEGIQALSCTLIQTGLGPVSGLQYNDNWLDGGYICINIGGTNGYLDSIGTMQRNKFGRNVRLGSGDTSQTINMPSYAALNTGDGTANQNIYEDTLAPILVRHNA